MLECGVNGLPNLKKNVFFQIFQNRLRRWKAYINAQLSRRSRNQHSPSEIGVILGRSHQFPKLSCLACPRRGCGSDINTTPPFLCEMFIYRYISLRALKWFKPEVSIFIGSQVISQNHMSEKSKFWQLCSHPRVFEVLTKGISWTVSNVKAHKIIK